MRRTVWLLAVVGIWVVPCPTWAGHKLNPEQERVLRQWLSPQPGLELANAGDCDCSEEISTTKRGYGGKWAPVPDYDPYVAAGDFNGDGVDDFAVALITRAAPERKFTLVVFNGPRARKPSFVERGLDLAHQGLFYGPPRPKPYRLLLGRFEAEGAILEPKGRSYEWRQNPQ